MNKLLMYLKHNDFNVRTMRDSLISCGYPLHENIEVTEWIIRIQHYNILYYININLSDGILDQRVQISWNSLLFPFVVSLVAHGFPVERGRYIVRTRSRSRVFSLYVHFFLFLYWHGRGRLPGNNVRWRLLKRF